MIFYVEPEGSFLYLKIQKIDIKNASDFSDALYFI